MSTLYVALILAAIIALLSLVTKPKSIGHEQESKTSHVLKMALISFVVIYFGLGYLGTTACPEITVGEPDF